MSKSRVPSNHRSRYTLHLSENKALDLIAAAVHAIQIGLPLNRFVSINFTRADLLVRPQDAISHYLKLAGQWLADRDTPPTFIWIIEQACGTGLHVHLLLHCPAMLVTEFEYHARSRWLSTAEIDPGRGVRKCVPIGPRGFDGKGASEADKKLYRNKLGGLLRYLLKSLDPEEPSSLDDHLPKSSRRSAANILKVRVEYCSAIYGRRCSRSQNIGRSAREHWNHYRWLTNADNQSVGVPPPSSPPKHRTPY